MTETITIRDTVDGTVEECDIIETYSHSGVEFAKVVGDTISGFVELP